jgi:hypothetical protein
LASGKRDSSKKRKLRSTGRHTAPLTPAQVVRRCGLAAPVVVAAGALVAVPQVRDLVTGTPTASVAQRPLTRDLFPDQVTGSVPQSLTSNRSATARASTHPRRHAQVHRHASAAVSTPSASPSVSATPTPASTPTPTTSSSAPTGTVQCSADASGPLPENYAAIVSFLTAHGYTGLAAAGIAGNIYQESGGNPESVGTCGGGLIGWTPLPAGFVTGDVAADLQTQLEALLTFNQQWAQYIPQLNASTTAAQAAYVYMSYFERPGVPAAGNREAAATAVAQACGL